MALIPDRRHNEQDDSGPASTPTPASLEKQNSAEPTYRELLERAGLDLTGHPLADRFDGIVAEPVDDDPEGESSANPSALQGSDARDGEGCGRADWLRRRPRQRSRPASKWLKRDRKPG